MSKIHHKSPHDLEFELSYLDYLKHSNFLYNVPSAIPTKNRGLFVTIQDNYYWLYKFLEGRGVDRFDQSHLSQLAQMMAQYHSLVETSNLNNGKPSSDLYTRTLTLNEIEKYRKEILRRNKANRKENIFLEESAKLVPILRGLDHSSRSKIGRYPIHRDLVSENLLWKQGKLVGVIDFEHVSETNDPVVKDLAVTMQYCCRDNKIRHQLDIDSASRFLRAYLESRPLSEGEVVMIPDLMTAGFVEDFVFAFWMVRNDPKRAKQSEGEGYGLTLYSKAAQWSHSNRERFVQTFLRTKDNS